jgi:2-keto-4-pentenoate hydratase/2-oxohepta-3-ene-1,7-dioic acid hydratase in catechol pathway
MKTVGRLRRTSRVVQAFTLLPGDLIRTGAPEGVGVFGDPTDFLGHGDVVEMEIERIGLLRNECNVREA